MLKTEAYTQLKVMLLEASDQQAQDVADILLLGAGDLGLPEGAVFTIPAELPESRRQAYLTLSDAIGYTFDSTRYRWHEEDPEFWPSRVGMWETVLVSLVLEGEWDLIHQTAEDLRNMGDGPPPHDHATGTGMYDRGDTID